MCHIIRALLTAIVISIFVTTYSQQCLTFPIIGSSHLFNWKDVSKMPSKSDVDKLIKDNPKEFQAYRQKDPDIAFLNLDSLRKDLYFITTVR
jgi:hypothetical protein